MTPHYKFCGHGSKLVALMISKRAGKGLECSERVSHEQREAYVEYTDAHYK